jgi:Rrf2 family protein
MADMAARRGASPLRVTERVDYALKSVVLLCLHDGDYLTAKAIADHYGMSPKMLGVVLWSLRNAGILESRPGWHGGFRLARPPEVIPVQTVIAAAANEEEAAIAPLTETLRAEGLPSSAIAMHAREGAAQLVARFWQALNDHVQGTLTAFTVADLAEDRTLPRPCP